MNEYIKTDIDNHPNLGLGIMRLKQNEDATFPTETYSLIHNAYKRGIRYFDTGFEYLKGKLGGEKL